MDLTVFMVTRDNSGTIRDSLESIAPLGCRVVILDQGSRDETVDIARSFGFETSRAHPTSRSQALNEASDRCKTTLAMMIQPWETLHQGHLALNEVNCSASVQILNETVICSENRIWHVKDQKWENPVFEFIPGELCDLLPVLIYGIGVPDYRSYLPVIESWKIAEPTSSRPFYYQALSMLAVGNLEEFTRISEHFMFLDQRNGIANILNRYYYALVQLQRKNDVRPIAQNLAICLATRPLMAEFWCLLGDMYYHLHHDFRRARLFYENAIVLGSRRISNDSWPMDISKYEEYPERMISSCDTLIASKALYCQ